MLTSLTAVKSRLYNSRVVCLCYFYISNQVNLDFRAGACPCSVASQISFYASGMRSKEEMSRRLHAVFYSHSAIFSFSPHSSSVCDHIFDIIEMILIPNLLFLIILHVLLYLSLYNDFIKVKNLQKSFFEQLLIKLNDWIQ